MELHKLQEKFIPSQIHWRVARATKKGDKVQVLAYLDSRDVMYRLDKVCGAENWRDEYKEAPDGGVLCGLSIRCKEEWVTKWDGAENTNVEGVKGGLSDSFKRAAVKWGIGRYLYYLGTTYAPLQDQGEYSHYNKETKQYKYWNRPTLPPSFLPDTTPSK